MVIISQEAIQDVATFYANTLLKYPNTWTQQMVDTNIEKTIMQMENVIINTLHGERTPLLQQLNNGQTAELNTPNRKWYFSVKLENDDTIIENAWYCSNASNRAFRRGVVNPNADLSLDNRDNQKRLPEERKKHTELIITESQLRDIVRNVLRKQFNIA